MSEHPTVLVTGVSRGLGQIIARRLIDGGATVLGLSRGAPPDDLLAAGDRFRHAAVDLADVDQLRARVFGTDALVPHDLPLDGLVNNAALAVDDLITGAALADVDRMLRVNVLAAIELTNGAIRNMLVHRRGGSLVHISSVAARVGMKGLAMYGATKAALEAFSRGAAREWGARGIRSNTVAAGFLETGMSDRLDDRLRERVLRRSSLGRATDAAAVADVVASLVDGRLASITGQTFVIDSGLAG